MHIHTNVPKMAGTITSSIGNALSLCTFVLFIVSTQSVPKLITHPAKT